MPKLRKEFHIQTYRAFNRIVLAGGASYTLDEQYMGSEEKMLHRPQGQASVDQFLSDKNLAYVAGDTLDVQRFLEAVVAGATPSPDVKNAWTTKAVWERFLAAPNLRLVRNTPIVGKTILRAVADGKIAVSAYPKSPHARKVIQAQEKWSIAKKFFTFFSHRTKSRRNLFIQE